LGIRYQSVQVITLYVSRRTFAPAGYLASTAEDMSKWMYFLASGGKSLAGEQVVDAEVLRRTFRSESLGDIPPLPLNPPTFPVQLTPFDRYGLGWFLGYHRGNSLYSVDED